EENDKTKDNVRSGIQPITCTPVSKQTKIQMPMKRKYKNISSSSSNDDCEFPTLQDVIRKGRNVDKKQTKKRKTQHRNHT
ncbi:hypothetical protein ACJMK2_028291, partial [Sinanodonta woodiana]